MTDLATLEATAKACYDAYLDMTGAFTEPDWSRLTTAQREIWRRIVETAWGKR